MSDPDRSGPYTCHGPMKAVTLEALTGGTLRTGGVAVFVCTCGIWRHGFSIHESQLRSIVEQHMPVFLAKEKSK